ncbi:hypothetical protein [Nocardia brevicatena]|uniref:hypothetical protein n=1 Tax=Nocardia brevicatena TaxID=37327 RepID=UPI0005926CB6|nr:hypothetical protein [Nocardia brevicatena]
MSTSTSRPHTPGTSRPGVPLPGRHLPGAQVADTPADPERIRAEVDELLAELDSRTGAAGADTFGNDLARRAHILEQAHDVLVQALATVDKI